MQLKDHKVSHSCLTEFCLLKYNCKYHVQPSSSLKGKTDPFSFLPRLQNIIAVVPTAVRSQGEKSHRCYRMIQYNISSKLGQCNRKFVPVTFGATKGALYPVKNLLHACIDSGQQSTHNPLHIESLLGGSNGNITTHTLDGRTVLDLGKEFLVCTCGKCCVE